MNMLIDELQWRGLIQDIIPGTDEQLNKEMTIGYVGFDPTSDSLHIGSLVPIILLMHLQKAGHKPIALVGGATGMVGDPSGKSEERNMLSSAQIDINVQGIQKQLSKFLAFDSTAPNGALLVNNYDWFKEISFLDFIRDVGKYITVNYMLSKDSVQKRLETGMSFTEFSYQLVQGYDFYHLSQTLNVKLQMGGSDQWGNIVTGTELIRKKSGADAFAFTSPLIKKADGGKFGKTETGNVWLDAGKTSPYRFYQFWLNVSDADAISYIKIFTFIPRTEIEELIAAHEEAPHARILQKRLAQEVTTMVHSAEEYQFAVEASTILFSDQAADSLLALSEDQLLDILDGVPTFQYPLSAFSTGIDIVTLLSETGILPSKGEARKLISSGGISVNKRKIADIDVVIDSTYLLNQKYVLVQKGKKNYHLLIASA
jgi:tyrosyl-tRNA synthetase